MLNRTKHKKFVHTLKNNTCIGIDLDGVVIDHTRQFFLACKKRGFIFKPWQVNTNVLGRFLPLNIYMAVKSDVYEKRRPHALRMPGSLQTVRLLAKHIHVASVQKQEESEKRLWTWLRKHKFLTCLNRRQFHIFRTRAQKLRFLKKLKPQVFIDDGLDVLKGLPHATRPILFDPVGAYKHIKVSHGMVVAKSWREIRKLL